MAEALNAGARSHWLLGRRREKASRRGVDNNDEIKKKKSVETIEWAARGTSN